MSRRTTSLCTRPPYHPSTRRKRVGCPVRCLSHSKAAAAAVDDVTVDAAAAAAAAEQDSSRDACSCDDCTVSNL